MEEEEEEQQAPDETLDIRRHFSRSVRDVGDEVGWGRVTSWQIVHILLRNHADYGGSSLLPLDQNTGRIQPMDSWLEEVAEHFDLDAVTTSKREVIDGRMTILGLTFVDPNLASALESAGFRKRLEDDLGPALKTVLRSSPGRPPQDLGSDPPDTLAGMSNRAQMLMAQGNLAEARALQEEVLARSRRVFGEDHLNTLASMSNLAETLRAQGELADARALQEQVLAQRQRVLGPDHPDTLTSVDNLARTLGELGAIDEARALTEKELETSEAAGDHVDLPANGAQDDQQDAIELIGDLAATKDELGRAPIAHDLARRLVRIHHDDPDHRGSFLVHLDGHWGSGKSSILNFLRDDLEGRDPPWLVVDFNAWRERRARPPWWALISTLRATVQADLGWFDRKRLRVAETWERLSARGAAYGLGTLLFGVALIALVIAWIVGLLPRDLGLIAGLITGVVGAIGLVWGLSHLTGRFVFWDSARRARAFEQTEEQPMQALAQHFSWLIDAVASRRFERLLDARPPGDWRRWIDQGRSLRPSGNRPTIFFLDDLDRCEAEHVVELMEAVQNLIRDAGSSRGPYFVVAADGRWIRRSYESWFERFQESVQERGRPLGYLFLDKLFQMSVHVPSLTGGDQDGFMGRLLGVEAGAIPAPETSVQEPPSKEQVLQRVEAGAGEEDFTAAVAMAEALPAAERQEVVARVVAREAEQVQAEITAHRLQPYARHLPPNPRTMKRFVNAYEIARAVDRVEGRAVTPEQRAIWTVLRLRWPILAEELQLDPDLLDALDELPKDPEREAMLKLLGHADIVRLLTTAEGAPFRAADLRACCGVEDPAPREPTPV